MFTEGSYYMYNATRRRAFFKSVTILIPKSWTTKPEYRQASNESYNNADILIGKLCFISSLTWVTHSVINTSKSLFFHEAHE